MADVSMYVTSEVTSSERRISPTWSIATLRGKLEQITGIPPLSQKLFVYGQNNENSTPVPENSDEQLIGQYNLVPFGRIHVEDTRPPAAVADFNDVSQVEKYVMPQDEYSNRQDTVLQWKKKNQLGRFDPNATNFDSEAEEAALKAVQAKHIEIGKRCLVNGTRRGTVKFVGKVPEINNHDWVGVEFDEPQGKNDGSIKGTRYFEARANHGSFVKPEVIEIGDFPVEDLEDDDDDDEL